MKKIFKTLLFIGAAILGGGLIFVISMFFEAREHRDQINSTIHICIEMEEEIPGLKTAELHMCDETNSFTVQSLKDTVSENIGVRYEEFPCKTFFKYIFTDGISKNISVEDFNCAGCSGTHVYTLSSDSATYIYMP